MKKNANDKLSYWMDGISNMKLGEAKKIIEKDCANCKHHPDRESDRIICEKCTQEIIKNRQFYTEWEEVDKCLKKYGDQKI